MTAINTTTLAVTDLRIDEKANVRRHGRGADPQMIASIKAIGLRQPLLVRPNGKGHVVIDGGKRFEAIAELVKAGELPKDYAVPVIIASADDAKARETSLALNVIRTNMHPVDEFRAFHQLHTDKTNPQTPEQIAARFGISTKGVVQRLALGALDDSVLNAWLAGSKSMAAIERLSQPLTPKRGGVRSKNSWGEPFAAARPLFAAAKRRPIQKAA